MRHVFIGNLHPTTRSSDVKQFLKDNGHVAYHVHTILNRQYIEEEHTDDRKKIVNDINGWLEVHKYGFAFFKTPKKARDAVESIHRSWLDGRTLRSYITYYHDQPERTTSHKVKSGRILRKPRNVAKMIQKKPAARKG